MKLIEKVGDEAGKVFYNPSVGLCRIDLLANGTTVVTSLVGYHRIELDDEGRDESGELQLFPAKGMSWDDYDSSLPTYSVDNYDLLREGIKTAVAQLYHLMSVREHWITTDAFGFEESYSIVDMCDGIRVIGDIEHKHLFEFPTRKMALQFMSTYYFQLKDIRRYLI